MAGITETDTHTREKGKLGLYIHTETHSGINRELDTAAVKKGTGETN